MVRKPRRMVFSDDVGEPLPLLAAARRTDPETSHTAAIRMNRTGRAAEQRQAVLMALHANPGSTTAELAEAMGVDRHVPGRRMSELEKQGMALRGETRVCQARGTKAQEWWPTQGGRIG